MKFKVTFIKDGKKKTVSVEANTEKKACFKVSAEHNLKVNSQDIKKVQLMECRHCGCEEEVSDQSLCPVCANILSWVNLQRTNAKKNDITLEEHCLEQMAHLDKLGRKFRNLHQMIHNGKELPKPTAYVKKWNKETLNGTI